MPRWNTKTLEAIASSDDFHLAPYREDGATPGTLIWVWAVVVDDCVYVRTSNFESRWFAAAMRERAGVIRTATYSGPVTFAPVADEALKDRVDEAFAAKYGQDRYFSPDLLERSRGHIARVDP